MRHVGVRGGTGGRFVTVGFAHSHGGDGSVPAGHEVDGDHRHAGLAPG